MMARNPKKLSRPPEYLAYTDAKQRCTNSAKPGYKYYGARGIKFKFSDFTEFIGYIGLKPNPKLSLDRIDNDGHYEIGNVKWSTKKQQNDNRGPITRPRLPGTRGTFFLTRLKGKPWAAYIKKQGHKLHLGYFKSEELAHQAYVKARKELDV